jgi:NAD+ synthetase
MNNIVKNNLEDLINNSNSDRKTNLRINSLIKYLREWNIKSVTLGVSGGIDSAFVLEMLLKAKKKYSFKINTVFFIHELHNNEADKKIVDDFIKGKDVNHHIFNLKTLISATQDIDETENVVNTQYAYALMYTILFRFAQKYQGITIGTTNRDEFGIGWFGKTSDMVVDVQPIHDFYKFEIYKSYLTKNIPYSIKRKAPNGNILSGKTDEDVFGCSYNEVSSIVDLMERNKLTSDVLDDYAMLNDVIKSNNHKLIKPKSEFNPIFL